MQCIAHIAYAIAECAVSPGPVGNVAVLTGVLECECRSIGTVVVSIKVTHSGITCVSSGISDHVGSGSNKVGTCLWFNCDCDVTTLERTGTIASVQGQVCCELLINVA